MAYGYPQAPSAPYPYPQQADAGQGRVGTVVNMAGAVLSVALVAGVGLWSYRLMVRDVSGIPVVRALDGPMRVSPDEPGGRQAAYQGLAVNNVAAEGVAREGTQSIALAPGGTDLSAEDHPRSLAAAAAPASAILAVASEPVSAPVTTPAGPVGDLIASNVPGVSRTPFPPRRPGGLATNAAPAATERFAAAAAPSAPSGAGDSAAEAAVAEIATRLSTASRTTEIDATTLPIGTRLVQFGAYETDSEARRYWDELAVRYPSYLDGRARVIEPATAGGRIFYRLRGHGFRDEAEARRFCSVFIAEDLDCTPVQVR